MLEFLRKFVSIFSQLLIIAIFARVVMSWMRVSSHNFLVAIIVQSTEPILGLFRRILPPLGGVLDLSPLLAFFAIDIARNILLKILA